MRRLLAVAALTVAFAVGGCGGSDDDEGQDAPQQSGPPPRETVDRLPKLPESWHPYVDSRAGFALGLPRGWTVRRTDAGALVRSYDHLVAVSIAVDRRPDALAEPPVEYAEGTVERLSGFKEQLRRRSVRRFGHRYDGTEVRVRGTAKGGIDQRVSVIVLRRDSVALLTAVVAANAKASADESLHLAKRVVATLRTRPPEGFKIKRAHPDDEGKK